MTQSGGDSFIFSGDNTMSGPTAFGDHAQAWTGSADTPWRAQLANQIAEFRDDYDRNEPAMKPSESSEIETALREVTGSLRARPFSKADVIGRVKRLAAVASTVAGMTIAAERIHDLVSGM